MYGVVRGHQHKAYYTLLQGTGPQSYKLNMQNICHEQNKTKQNKKTNKKKKNPKNICL